MSDPKGNPNDPSMDDILASIRKIISDDEARAQVAGQRPAGPSANSSANLSGNPSGRPPVVPPAPRSAPSPTRDDVLLLTDLVEDPKTTSDAQPVPLPRIDPVRAAEMPQPSTEPPPGESLVGAGVAGAASSAFSRLNQAVQDSVPQPAAQDPGPTIGNGGKTVEDLVKEMLRPMLKDWLDKNLPPMVERYVEREITRLTRR
jgi:cell pole-organizing protein PopZ